MELILEKSSLVSFENIYNSQYPENPNHWYPGFKIPFSGLMIHRPSHPKPDSKNSSEYRKDPECFFRNSPPLVDRLKFVYAHHQVGKDIDTKKAIE